MLAEMAADVQTIRFAQQVVCARIDAGEAVPGDAAILKLKSSEMACRVADQALQLMGGVGYMTDNEISRIYRDVRIWRIVDGTSEMQKTVIARDVLAHPERYV
jgi:alkylation response protein AidB-like acyl-CoA dehydrogenase